MGIFAGNSIYNDGGGSVDASKFVNNFKITDVTNSYTDRIVDGNIDVVHFKAYAYSLHNEDDEFLSMVGLRFELSAKYKTNIAASAWAEVAVMNLGGIINPVRLRVPVMCYNNLNPNGQLDRDALLFLTNYNNVNNLAQEGDPGANVFICGWNASVPLVGFAVCFDYLGASYV